MIVDWYNELRLHTCNSNNLFIRNGLGCYMYTMCARCGKDTFDCILQCWIRISSPKCAGLHNLARRYTHTSSMLTWWYPHLHDICTLTWHADISCECVRSIPWLLPTFLISSPRTQQPRYQIYGIQVSLFSMRKYFRHILYSISYVPVDESSVTCVEYYGHFTYTSY